MSVKLMVLGILHDTGEAHGYTILRQLGSWRAETWTAIKPGSVYHALGQFEKHALAKNLGSKQGGGPSATSYKITPKGVAALHELVAKALVSYDQEEFAAGLAWMHVLSRSQVLTLAKQRLAEHRDACSFLDTLPHSSQPNAPSENPEIIGSWHAIFAAVAVWQEDFIARIEGGAYSFTGDAD